MRLLVVEDNDRLSDLLKKGLGEIGFATVFGAIVADLAPVDLRGGDMGLTRTAVAFAARGRQGAGLVGLSGIAGVLIGILILAKLPSSADWAIGLLVGIDLIFAGWTLVSVALVGKDLSRGA